MEEDQRHYESLTARLKEKHLADKLAAGMGEKEANRAAEKQAIEDARFVLPNACTTKILMTMNARSLMNFFHHCAAATGPSGKSANWLSGCSSSAWRSPPICLRTPAPPASPAPAPRARCPAAGPKRCGPVISS